MSDSVLNKTSLQKTSPELQLYEVPALGRAVALGELYDVRTDQIGPGFLQANMADDFVVTKHGRTSFQTFQKDEMSSITSSWGMSADLKLGVLSQTVQCAGSVRYLNDRGRFSCTYGSAAKVTMETETRQLKKPCSSYCKGQNAAEYGATHFVYKIQYGSEAVFLFSEDKEAQETSKTVGGGLSLQSQLPVGFSVNVDNKSSSATSKDVFRCEFYGDFKLDVLPRSCEEARALCQDIPKHMEPAHGVPMKIWLYPLPGGEILYRSLSDSVAEKVTGTLEQFERLAGRLRMLRERKAVQALPNMAAAVKQLQTHFTEFLRTFKSEIKKLHSGIKRRNREEAAMLDVLQKLRELPFSAENLKRWLEGREEEADILEVVSEHSNTGQEGDAKCRVTLVVRVYCQQPDTYSQLLDTVVRKYREEGGSILNLDTKMSEDECRALDCMFDEDHKSVLNEFDHCYQNLKDDNDIHFELAEEGMDDPSDTGPVYFEIHDIASQHRRFTERALLPDGVSSLKVSGFLLFRRLTWKAPRRSRSLVTSYQVTYSKGDTEGYEKWLKSDQRSLALKCSAKNDIRGIEVRPYCGQMVKGPGYPALYDLDTGLSSSFVEKTRRLGEAVEAEAGIIDAEGDQSLPSTDAVPQVAIRRIQMLMDGQDSQWQPGGVAVMSDGRIAITDMDNNCLRISTTSSTKAGCDPPTKLPEERLHTDGSFESPWEVAIDEQDNIYVLDNEGLHVLDRKGKCLETTQHEIPENSGGLVVTGGRLWIIDMERDTCRVYRIGNSGHVTHVSSRDLGHKSLEIEDSVRGVALDHEGNIYVSDPDSHAIHKYNSEWQLLGQIQTGEVYPGPMDWHPGHGLLTVDMVNRRVWLLTPAGKQ